MSRLDRRNRIIASVVGLVLVGAGVYVLARSFGALGDDQMATPVLDGGLRRAVTDNAGPFWGAVTFIALVVAWLGWRWLRLQLVPASPSIGRLRLAGSGGGQTSVEAAALADAVSRDLQSGPGVTSARVRLRGHQQVPTLDLRAEVATGTPPAAVRRHVDDFLVPRVRAALEREDIPVSLRLVLADPTSRVVE